MENFVELKTLETGSFRDSHLNSAFASSEHKRFGEDMKGLNEFIGVLQIAKRTLGKMQSAVNAEILIAKEGIKGVERNECDNILSALATASECEKIMKETKFMGDYIFGTQFSARLNGAEKGFYIDNPLALLPNFEDIGTYVEDKMYEAAELLWELSSHKKSRWVEE